VFWLDNLETTQFPSSLVILTNQNNLIQCIVFWLDNLETTQVAKCLWLFW
jgi:hypothetical protein